MAKSWYELPWKRYEKELLDIQFDIAAAYMSGNLRLTKQLISELTKHEAAISIAVKRVTAKTSRRTPDNVADDDDVNDDSSN